MLKHLFFLILTLICFQNAVADFSLEIPGNEALEEYLIANLTEAKLCYYPNPGNAGDALIWYGTVCLLKKLGINYTPYHQGINLERSTIDVIMYGGGGNLVPYYRDCSNFLKEYIHTYKSLIVLPQSIQGHHALIESLSPNVTLFCREQMSYDYCKSIMPFPEKALFASDLAFYADVTSFIEEKKESNNPPKVLYAFRTDQEVNDSRKLIPLPKANQDISLRCGSITEKSSFESNYAVVKRFLNTINAYDVVWTDRLHVGIGAFLLGKEVHLFDNSYGKNRAVYESSIQYLDDLKRVFFHEDWEIISSIF